MGAVIISNNIIKKLNSVILPKKYLNYLDVFNKMHADKFPYHSEHNLTIKIEKGKQPFFDRTYDYFQLKLEVLCKYINEILDKRFIVPLKLLAGASIFLQKRKMTSYICI